MVTHLEIHRRDVLGLTQAEMARRAECRQALISDIENGRRIPPKRAKRLARAYKLTVEQLTALQAQTIQSLLLELANEFPGEAAK
jgi:transcriptional regulator with XRE-family HTH domain